jgi:hypothetical protein
MHRLYEKRPDGSFRGIIVFRVMLAQCWENCQNLVLSVLTGGLRYS